MLKLISKLDSDLDFFQGGGVTRKKRQIIFQRPDKVTYKVLHPKTSEPTETTIESPFKEGSFGGGGASVLFHDILPKELEDLITYIPIPLQRSFTEAFAEARRLGKKTFQFNGKTYTTEVSSNPSYSKKEYEVIPMTLRTVSDHKGNVYVDSTSVIPGVSLAGEFARSEDPISVKKFGGYLKLIPKALEGFAVVKRGDKLSKIAQQNNIPMKQLVEYNSIADPDKIKVGDTLYFPPKLITKPQADSTAIDSTAIDSVANNSKPLINEGNYIEYALRLLKAFEEFHPKVKATTNTSDGGTTYVLGYGMSEYINPDGTTRGFYPEETITKQRADELLQRWYLFKLPGLIKEIKLKNYDYYSPEVKLTLIDGLFNGGKGMVIDNSPNYSQALKAYDSSFQNGSSNYNINNLQIHADWNRTKKGKDNGFIGLRSLIRQYPNTLSWDIINDSLYHIPRSTVSRIKTEWRNTIER